MDYTSKLIIFWILIILTFGAGSLCRNYFISPQKISKHLILINLVLLEPLVLLWTVWGLEINYEILILPAAGICTVAAGFSAGRFLAGRAELPAASRPSFIISSTLSNQGMTMGGMICYLIAGEQGLALASIYLIYYLPFVFIFIFPYARSSSMRIRHNDKSRSLYIFLKNLALFMKNPRNLPPAGIIAAFILQCLEVKRPEIYFPLDLLLFAVVSVYYFTLGLSFIFSDIFSYRRELLLMSLVKFIFIPLLTFAVLTGIETGKEIRAVILIESFMPAAVYSVITALLYDLDWRMNSSLFVTNTMLFLILVLPLMFLFKNYLFI